MVKVVIIGGGISGLSAATLLAEHPNFDIEIYEKEKEIGGQAASMYNSNCNIEHSWRIFGSTYYNIWYIFNKFLKNMHEFTPFIHNCVIKEDKVKPGDPSLSDLVPQILRSSSVSQYYKYIDLLFLSKERLIKEYDHVNALDYFNDNMIVKSIIGPYQGIEATKVSVSSVLKNIYQQLDNKRYEFLPEEPVITIKPTSDSIFQYWDKHLTSKNVPIYKNHTLEDISMEGGKIKYIQMNSKKVYADEFVFACSLKPLNQILEKKEPCTTFEHMKELEQNMQLYFTINFYFNKKIKMDCQHIILEKEAWLPTIQQKVYWPDEIMKKCTFENKEVKDVWNVAFLDYVPGMKIPKILRDCTLEEAIEEGLFQVKQNKYILEVMKKNEVTFEDAFLGYDVWHQYKNSSETFPVIENTSTPLSKISDLNPKFSPNQGTMKFIPETHPKDLPSNMGLCGYYVQNTYGGASMEASCETGLIAADYVLKKHKVKNETILPIKHENKYLTNTFVFKPWIKLDEMLYGRNMSPITKTINSFYLLIFTFVIYAAMVWVILYFLFHLKTFNIARPLRILKKSRS